MKRRNKSTDSGGRAAPSVESSDQIAPGTVLGKYRIVERLGTGGMGSVYKAVHTGIAKSVALKTMSPQLAADPRTSARFLREAASASRLDHPHVVGVTDFGNDLGVSYLVMELLRGEDLGALIARSPGGLPTVMVADIMLAVCAGVFAAHESGVVHRDLKPPNIFVAQTSLGETVPKVLDFGISKMIEEDGSSPLTNTGMVMGTTHYLSPEQVAGKGADVRSDQYALGVIMYEALTGQRPFVGSSAYEIMRNISEGAHPPVRSLRKDLTPAFEAVIVRAMAVDAHNRFESVHGLGRALLPFASPKRRVMWADYYERDSGRTSDPRLSARAESGETIALDVRPAQLSPTRTHFMAAPPPVAPVPSTPVSGTGVVEFPDSLSTGDYRAMGLSRGRRRWGPALLFALGASIGVLMFWKIPGLRAKLPAVVQTALERTTEARPPVTEATTEAAARTEQPSPAPTQPPTTVTTQTAPTNGNPRISPFSTNDRSSSWPFEPPSKDESKYKAAAISPSHDAGVADAGAAEVASGDGGLRGADVGRTPATPAAPVAASAPSGAAAPTAVVKARPIRLPNPDRELPVVYPRSRRQQSDRVLHGLPPASQPRRVPPKPQTPTAESGLAPPATQEPAPVPPEQIPPRRYFPAGGAPILD
jgi:serine/threonine protein kinase